MTRYALLLRGVNVGTKNALPMAKLRDMLEALGCRDVMTYIQSGNAVFASELTAAALTNAIEAALARYMRRPIATVLRTRRQLQAIVDGNPFANIATNPSHLCVTFLSAAATRAELAPLHERDFTPELFQAVGKELYSWYPNGQGKSQLAVAIGKLALRGCMTTRNWNTVLKLLAMVKQQDATATR
ncbi:MAG: DUF1697 domain-containing protein [Kofleriaceae bacterium]